MVVWFAANHSDRLRKQEKPEDINDTKAVIENTVESANSFLLVRSSVSLTVVEMSFILFLVIYLGNISIFCFCFDLDGGMGKYATKLDKFVENQFYETCFGIDMFEKMKSLQENATSICTASTSTVATTLSPSHLGNLQSQPRPMWGGWPGYPAATFPLDIFKMRNKSLYRSKRNLKTKLDEIKQKMSSKLQKISCILHKSGITTSEGNIDTLGMLETVNSMSLDINLKSDLKQSIEDCRKVVKCFSESSVDNDAMGEHGEAIEFINCYEKKKKEACVKKSIRERLMAQLREDMSLEEIQNILSRGSTNSPLYYSAFPGIENIVQAIFIADYQ